MRSVFTAFPAMQLLTQLLVRAQQFLQVFQQLFVFAIGLRVGRMV
eukprot:SAG11_NODE_96_length_17016_cov_18.755113_8_plen_45_part_00